MSPMTESGVGPGRMVLSPTGPWGMDWRIQCGDVNSTSISVSIDDEVYPSLGMSGLFVNRDVLPDGSPSTDSISGSATSEEYGLVSIAITVGPECQWEVNVEQTPEGDAALTGDCPASITDVLTSYGLGELPMSDLETLVPVENHEYLYRMAEDIRSALEADPSLAQEPGQLFGSGQAAVALCN